MTLSYLLTHIRRITPALLLILPQCSNKPLNEALPVPAPQIEAPAPVVTTKYTFQVGDQLELFVREDGTLNGSYLVREGGYIVIPRAGRVNVVGLTREEAEPKVKEFLKVTQLKEASVIVERTPGINSRVPGVGGVPSIQVPRILVYLTGSVPKSGGHAIPVPPGKTVGVYEALLISGGIGKFAQTNKVEVFRSDATGKRKKTTIDLRPIINGEQDDPAIAEGDIINVPAKVFGF